MRLASESVVGYCVLLVIFVQTLLRSHDGRLAAGVQAQVTAGEKLPLLWSSVLSDLNKSYHVLYQLKMAHSVELLTVEEWGFYERHLFRIDLISDAIRTIYLFNGQTGEIFRYRPYVCDLLDPNKVEDFDVFSKLFIGYPWSSGQPSDGMSTDAKDRTSQIVAYGLGPLWLRARQDAASVELLDTTVSHELADEFQEFEVTFKDKLIENQVDYKLRFFFLTGEQHFVDSIDWLVPRSTSNDFHASDEPYEARLKVLMVDYETPDESIFRLPVGYGCRRRSDLDHSVQLNAGVVLLHQGAPNQVLLDVTFGQPHDELLHTWTSQRYSMRWLRYSRPHVNDVAKTESYYVNLMQMRTQLSGGKLQRMKRIWWAPDSQTGQATVYEMNQMSGSCYVSHRNVRDQLMLGSLDMDALNENAPVMGHQSFRPMVLSADQISFLFGDSADYHLIDPGKPLDVGASDPEMFRDRYYEKRVEKFKLTTDGSITWEGPVSIVKRISSNTLSSQERKSNLGVSKRERSKISLFWDYQTQLTIYFYSDKFERLMYKIVIDLLGNHEVNYDYVHKQLDVSACVEPSPSSLSSEDTEEDPEDSKKQLITISYPIERLETLNSLKDREDAIRTALFLNLFNVCHSKSFLSPLQISSIQLSFDMFQLQVQLTLLDLPLTQLFELTLDYGLDARDPLSYSSENSLMYLSASSALLCAEHCEYYNCLRFAYELSTRTCTVALVGDSHVKPVAHAGSLLFTYFDRRQKRPLSPDLKGAVSERSENNDDESRPHLNAESLVEYFEQLVQSASLARDGNELKGIEPSFNPLVFEVLLRPHLTFLGDSEEAAALNKRNVARLVPSSLRHELESMKEYARELDEQRPDSNGSLAPGLSHSVRLLNGRLRLHYSRIMIDRAFKDLKVGDKLKGVSYEQCEQHCERTDCRSFAHCAFDHTCQVSQAHDDKLVASLTESATPKYQCAVYSLDYLSKFELYGRVLKPIEAKVSIKVSSARFCANLCMEQRSFACQGFYLCQIPSQNLANNLDNANTQEQRRPAPSMPANYECNLISKHVRNFARYERRQHFHGHLASGEDSDQAVGEQLGSMCTFYSRSYLAQFDKYRARRLEPPAFKRSGDTHIIESSSDLEECASRCIELGCLAFDSCPSQQAKGPSSGRQFSARHKCQLLFNGVERGQLKREPRCSTFVLSDKSQFNRAKLRLKLTEETDSGQQADSGGEPEPDQAADLGQMDNSKEVLDKGLERTQEHDISERELEQLERMGAHDVWTWGARLHEHLRSSSHWLRGGLSFIVGATLGVSFIALWNELYVRGLLDRLRGRMDGGWRRFTF